MKDTYIVYGILANNIYEEETNGKLLFLEVFTTRKPGQIATRGRRHIEIDTFISILITL